MRSAALLLVLLAAATHCGPVYTSPEPAWYNNCSGVASDCTCPLGSDEATQTPAVTECSAVAANGVCCSDGDTCGCVAIDCADDGNACDCTIHRNQSVLKGSPVASCPSTYSTCCLREGSTECICSNQPCASGDSPAMSGCSAARFECSFLQTDTMWGSTFGSMAVEACTSGPIQATVP